jgi:gliding motility-associated-like protein
MRSVFVLLTLFTCFQLKGQAPCTNPGQTPATAFPVCGTSTFQQTTVPICGNKRLVVPGCNDGAEYGDKNPYWYRFTCFASGSLSFTITPNDLQDDYDWQLFDITGRNPNDVFIDASLVVTGNWSGSSGTTGANSSGVNFIQCASNPIASRPRFARSPNIIAGRTYLLLVSHYTDSQSGYALSFNGGTAVITDPKLPLMQTVQPNCGGDELRLKLNKKMRCSSISPDGSDVVGFPGGITATGIRTNCINGFETDSVVIQLSAPLPPGAYTLRLKNGGDGNTFLDVCDRPIPLTDQLNFEYTIPQPTQLDSLAPVQCAPNAVRFVFKKQIKCSSIAPNGSDFTITGTYPVTVTGATGNCNADGLTWDIIVTFNQALQTAGNFTVRLNPGIDGNTVIDECNQVTPISQLSFAVKDTVNADFSYNINYGCQEDTVDYIHPGGNGINSWLWNFGTGGGRTNQTEQVIYRNFGNKTTSLIVSNGFCSDTTSQIIRLNNFILANFSVDAFNCPAEPVPIKAMPISERPLSYFWSFGDGQNSIDSQPAPHLYPVSLNDTKYTIRYTITNDLGCSNTAEKIITIVKTCRIDVPTAFTPNGDNLNDFFGPLNAIKAENYIFRIYNRWGGLLFESNNWLKMWDGTYKGILQEPGTYVWTLSYTDRDTKKDFVRKGTFVLIR